MSRSLDLLADACAPLNHTHRKMFGGHGFFAPNGGMFAGIVTDDEVIIKLTEGPLRDELISLGGHPWVYNGSDKPMTMKQWIVIPESFYDDPESLAHWASRAHGAVPGKPLKTAAKKKPAPKKGTAQPVKKSTAKKKLRAR